MRISIYFIVVVLSLNFTTAFAQNYIWFEAIINGNIEDVESMIDSDVDVNTV